MEKTKKQKLLELFDDPEVNFIGVLVDMPDCPKYEVIANPRANFPTKRAYYDKAYNDDLELISFPKIKIVDFDGDKAPEDSTKLFDKDE